MDSYIAERQATSLPDWLDYPLKHQPMLFIGCEIPDWLGRFLLRMSSDKRLSLREQSVLLRRLLNLATTFAVQLLCDVLPQYLVQQLEMEPTEFVAELRRRWEEKDPRPCSTIRRGRHPQSCRARSTRRSSLATCVRTPTRPGGCVTRSADSAVTSGLMSDS